MEDINPTVSILTLNVNGLNTLIKSQRLWEGVGKDQRLSKWIENKTKLYAGYKRHTLNIETKVG